MHELVFKVEQFLIHEAALLDDRRFTDWLALYDEDAWYWVPVLPSAAERGLALAHYDEDHTQMEARIKRLDQATAYSEQPPARTCRMIGNVRILAHEDNGALRVGSRLLMYEYRNRSTGRETRNIYAGTVQHLLRPGENTFSIAWKRIDLVDAEAGFYNTSVPI